MSSRCLSPLELKRSWSAVLGHLSIEVARPSYETWLADTRALTLDDHQLLVTAPRTLACDYLNERLSTVVQRAVAQVFGEEIEVQFIPERVDQREAGQAMRVSSFAAPVVGSVNTVYTFARYVAFEGNCLAVSSCRSLVEGPELRISPVVVYGPPGMGKTHLLHALAARAIEAGVSVACVNAEEFTTRFQSALRQHHVDDFRQAIRGARLLLLDDLQYLTGKKATLEELVLTLDAFTTAGGSIVIASEENPMHLDLPERLLSRLAAGIVTRVEPFGRHERMAYIVRLAGECGVVLPAWATERIAGCEVPSVRVLQGAVHAAVALARNDILDLRRLDAHLTRIALEAVTPAHAGSQEVLEAVAAHFKVKFEDVTGRSRAGAVGKARAVAIALLRQRGMSLNAIGEVLDGRDTKTISGLEERGRELLEHEPDLHELAS